MTIFSVENSISGHTFGTFSAPSATEAVLACLSDSGTEARVIDGSIEVLMGEEWEPCELSAREVESAELAGVQIAPAAPLWRVQNSLSGYSFGAFRGATATEAIVAMLRDAGYTGFRVIEGEIMKLAQTGWGECKWEPTELMATPWEGAAEECPVG